MRFASRVAAFVTAASFLLASCGGGGGGGNAGNNPNPGTTPTSVFAVPAQEALTAAEVGQIVAQAVGEAQARGVPSVISVVDRVGNVLAVYRMTGAPATAAIPRAASGANLDAQGVSFPAELGAIAKAITGAYLSSAGNAFSPRTASFIIQEHFPKAPNTVGLESGPLFGVQFSSLPCSDLVRRFGADASTGPKRSPLGLAGDPGGVPLYKNGVVVGGIGVMGDGDYSVDPNAIDHDQSDEEYVALAGSTGFEAPDSIRANRVSIDGTLLDFIEAVRANLQSNPSAPPALAGTGAYVAVRGYFAGAPIAGTPYGNAASGYRQATAAERTAGTAINHPDAFILVDTNNQNRYPLRAGTDAGDVAQPLTQAEVKAVLEEAFVVMSRARGAIRQPLDSRMQATISVVDTRGAALGIVRSPDAPVFGTDVSLQKARTAAFFSGSFAANELGASSSPDVSGFVAAFRSFLNDQTALTGKTAFAERPIGLLARPYFPDGQIGTPNGPLSRPIQDFSPFSTGLQSALIIGNIGQHLGFVQDTTGTAVDTPTHCSAVPDVGATGTNRLANGIQIFPGGVPIYRGNTLIGAVGVSGDGIDQDDMVSFLGLYNGGIRIGGIGHAATAMRVSQLSFPNADGGFLPYVQCPIAPFVDTAEQNVCQGK
jgi:uncharacterized protein GlcG (DUF336 family)